MNPTRFTSRTFTDTADDTLKVQRTGVYVDVRIAESDEHTLARVTPAMAREIAAALVECADAIQPLPVATPEPLATPDPHVPDEATVRLAALATLIEFVNGGASA